MIAEQYLDRIIETYTTGKYEQQVRHAKGEFFKLTGVVFENDPFFEERMDLFLEWYLFTRPLDNHDMPPVKLFYLEGEKKFNHEERDVYFGLTQILHSLFQLKKIKKNIFYLKDFFMDKAVQVCVTDTLTLSCGDIFEARLIPYQGKYYFGKGFCYHSPQTKTFIEQRIKKIKHLDETFKQKLLLDLASMRLKHDRYPHIDLKHIYSLDSKI
ncbi:MAG: hypothetical protein HYS98_02950 [Deltaproteobacteria bacterium]|nr:hypothetical protein [Deltaproteobacteria bacterium]